MAEALTTLSPLPTENRRRYCIGTEHGLDDPTKKEEQSRVFNRKDDDHRCKTQGSSGSGHQMTTYKPFVDVPLRVPF